MKIDSGLEACRLDMYTDEETLRQKYPVLLAEKVLRIREMHQWMLGHPSAKDAQFITETIAKFGVTKPTAYSDLKVLKALLPSLAESSKDFHRWRYNEMILDTFEMAKNRKDVRTMERAASSYAKFNKIDLEEKSDISIEQIVVQPFVPTDDPSILGIAKVPNIRERQKALLEKYIQESADIEDIEAEEVDITIPKFEPDGE